MPINKIVFTGPESSGKSYLASYVSEYFNLPLTVEYARIYLHENGLEYDINDFQNIINETITTFNNFQSGITQIVDTGFLNLKIWGEEVFRRTFPDIEQYIISSLDTTLYLLCKPDIPWEPDPMRENPHDRMRLYEKFEQYLEKLHAKFHRIDGNYQHRLNYTCNIVDSLIISNKGA